ncbi:MAG: hypothetical protein L0G94_04065 [Brachybacterium sp.]|uniref:hypothetical protein n=1 Tax=Brachybacterium sp. TaxID=1891286 RepID=UPI00264A16C0|nr:hypothetical protein [Brachybacterium sp.]MDN5685845.1 hypothetical protein [Brachybacterium sp.]
MGKQRKYLDRGRRIRLEGRPMDPDWMALLGAGRNAVLEGRADEAPFLSDVMWEGVSGFPRFPRAAAFDHPLIREWLHVDERAATAYLRQQWGMVRAPEDATEALSMMDSASCLIAGLGSHRLTADRFALPDPAEGGTWVAGPCRDCQRALLWFFPDDGSLPRVWQFYDHEAEYAGADTR